jgi:peptide/nickel transport system permease protein
MINMKEYFKNLLLTVLTFTVLLFITLYFSFMLSKFLPGDPVLAYLPGHYSAEEYNQIRNSLGLNDPPIVQFFRYSLNMLSGNWGRSVSISGGTLVSELIAQTLPRTLDLLFIPLIVSLILGYYIGKFSLKRTNSINRVIQITSLVILAIPIIIIGIGFQYLSLGGIFPVSGYKSIGYSDPPFVTGFRIIDSMLSGQWYFISDYIYHLILPCITLTIILLPFMIFLTRSYFLNKRSQSSTRLKYPVSSILATVGIGYGMVMSFAFLVEIIFGLNGFGQMLISSMKNFDYWPLNVFVFILPLTFTFIISGSMLLLTLHSYNKRNRANNFKIDKVEEKKQDLFIKDNKSQISFLQNFKTDMNDLGKYYLVKLRSLYTIIGGCITLFAIVISLFPNILTPYSYEEALGASQFGQGLLARIIYAIPSTLIPVLISIGVGLFGGLIIGILFNLVRNQYKLSIDGILIPLFMFPTMFAGIFFNLYLFLGLFSVVGSQLLFPGAIYEVIIIPIFALIITKAEFNLVAILKRLIPYIPLMIGFVLIIETCLGFLGFSDPRFIQFGTEISTGRSQLSVAPWATFYPGLAVFILQLGFFLLYAGLRPTPEEMSEIQRNF